MQIDWITVSAQIVNFLLLIWLLKRFLYQPVIRAMDRREQRIAERLSEAEQRERVADEANEQFREKTLTLEQERDEIFAEAKLTAEAQTKQMLDEARASAVDARAIWQRQALQEKDDFLRLLAREAAHGIEAIARKALGDLAGIELEEQIVQRFIERLKALDSKERRSLRGTSNAVQVVSAFELDPTLHGRLTRAAHEYIGEHLEIEYSQSPDLICGIELSSGGRRLSFNLAHYLDELSGRIDETLNATQAAAEVG